jgi:hypothetical protein
VTRLYYVTDFDDDIELDEELDEDYNRFKDDEVVNDDMRPQPFKGYFLFVENTVSKPQKSASISASKSVPKTYFEKICLVKVVNHVNPLMKMNTM